LVAGSKVLSYFADVRQSYGGLEFPRGHVRCLRQIMARKRRETFSPSHGVDYSLRSRLAGRRWRDVFDRRCSGFLGYILSPSRSGSRRRNRLLARELRLPLRGSRRRRKGRRAAKKQHGDENQ
jgi:hypothetical protein